MSMLSPARKFASMENSFNINSNISSDIDEAMFSDSAYLNLLEKKALLLSRIEMARTDSIYLTINLSDSTVNIEISGVVVHVSRMSTIELSKILINGDWKIRQSILASPFTVSNEISTIRKEPVMIKMAPKDTSEYIPDIIPDTSLTEPVNYILEMTNGTRLYVYQEETENFSDRMSFLNLDLRSRLRDTWYALKNVVLFKVPEYHPYIKIRLHRSDAKIIYRAIPKNCQVGLLR